MYRICCTGVLRHQRERLSMKSLKGLEVQPTRAEMRPVLQAKIPISPVGRYNPYELVVNSIAFKTIPTPPP